MHVCILCESNILVTCGGMAGLPGRGVLGDHQIKRREGFSRPTSEVPSNPCVPRLPTPQTIKQVARCPMGSSPGLVTGHFLSHCGKEQEEDRSLKAEALGVAWPPGWVGSGLGGENWAWLNSNQASPYPQRPLSFQRRYNPGSGQLSTPARAVEGLASVGKSRKKCIFP